MAAIGTFTAIFSHHFSAEVLSSPKTLWPYLKKIAENKVLDAARRHLDSTIRSLYREVPLSDFDDLLESRELSPPDLLMLKELIEERLENLIGQLPGLMRDIVYCMLAGFDENNTAARLGVEVKRVRRALRWLRKQDGMPADDDPED